MRPAYSGLSLRACRERDESGRFAPASIVLGRKFCPGCGRWRHLCDYSVTPHRGLRARCHVCARRQQHAHTVGRTAEQHARWLEYCRIYQNGKRREAGIPERNWGPKSRRGVVDGVERILLDAAPLVEQLEAYHARQLSWADSENSYLALASAAGVSNRIINRLISGESQRVRLAEADRLVVAMGLTLSLVYSWEEAA